MRMVNPQFSAAASNQLRPAKKQRTRGASAPSVMRDVWIMLALVVIVTLADNLFS